VKDRSGTCCWKRSTEVRCAMNSRLPTPPSTERRTAGLTLVELLIAVLVGALILGVAFSLTMSNRRLFQSDRSRTEANQNLRVALDLIGADARIAGDLMDDRNLPLPAIEVRGGNELIFRRKLVSGTLPLCGPIGDEFGPGSGTELPVSLQQADDPFASFCNWDDADGNGVPDHVEPYFERFERQGGRVSAYIYQPPAR